MAAGTASAAESLLRAPAEQVLDNFVVTRLTPTLIQPHQYRIFCNIGSASPIRQNAFRNGPRCRNSVGGPARASLDRNVPSGISGLHQQGGGTGIPGGKRDYGEQAERIADTRIWILPSTSGAAKGSWRPEVWHAFAAQVRSARATRLFPSPLVGEGGFAKRRRVRGSSTRILQRIHTPHP